MELYAPTGPRPAGCFMIDVPESNLFPNVSAYIFGMVYISKKNSKFLD